MSRRTRRTTRKSRLLLKKLLLTVHLPCSHSTCTVPTLALPVCLAKFLEGPPAFNNKAMANYLQSNYFTPPASAEYRLSGHDGMIPNLKELVQFIKTHFKDKVRHVLSLMILAPTPVTLLCESRLIRGSFAVMGLCPFFRLPIFLFQGVKHLIAIT